MAQLYAPATFGVTRLVQTDDELAMYGPPAGTAFTLDFDPSTNVVLLADIIAHMALYTYDGTNLKKSGITQAVAAASQDYTARSGWNTFLTQSQTYIGLASPTLAQTNAQVVLLTKAIMFLGRTLFRLKIV